jgi:hypothetical protein
MGNKMEQKEVELFVEKKIAEAKLEVSEKRNQFLLWFFGIMLTVVGVAIPLLLSNRSAEKVDEELSKMKSETKEIFLSQEKKIAEYENNFRETARDVSTQQNAALTTISNNADKALKETKEQVQNIIGRQLDKPELTCRFNGDEIEGKTIDVTNVHDWPSMFEIFNKGKATARNVSLVLYQKEGSKLYIQQEAPWRTRGVSEEKEYARSFNYDWVPNALDVIDPKYAVSLEPGLSFANDKTEYKEELLLKIYYGQPEPTKVHFFIEKGKKK